MRAGATIGAMGGYLDQAGSSPIWSALGRAAHARDLGRVVRARSRRAGARLRRPPLRCGRGAHHRGGEGDRGRGARAHGDRDEPGLHMRAAADRIGRRRGARAAQRGASHRRASP